MNSTTLNMHANEDRDRRSQQHGMRLLELSVCAPSDVEGEVEDRLARLVGNSAPGSTAVPEGCSELDNDESLPF